MLKRLRNFLSRFAPTEREFLPWAKVAPSPPTESSEKLMITTDQCAKEYSRLHQPKTQDELNSLYREGLVLFSDMAQFDDYYRKQSLVEFSNIYLVPLAVNKFKEKIKDALEYGYYEGVGDDAWYRDHDNDGKLTEHASVHRVMAEYFKETEEK